MSREIRLACMNCDREDCDGIDRLGEAVGWRDIDEVISIQETSEWWTHLGWCPECAAEEDKRLDSVFKEAQP